MKKYFISCDWGTSSFRLRLVESDSLKVLSEQRNSRGIADVHKEWLTTLGQDDPKHTGRQDFYIRIIDSQVEALIQNMPDNLGNLDGVPILLSGMASSTIGLIDMDYKELPFALDGSDLNVNMLRSGKQANPIVVISGACTSDDVMRGEETKVLGCVRFLKKDANVCLLMPGTHPKHIIIADGMVRGFKTYMTGEFFDLLTGQSILSGSVKTGGDMANPLFSQHFEEGVKESVEGNILHSSFMVRTRQVLRQLPAESNYFYLSGLLIGAELKDLTRNESVYLVSTGMHTSLYVKACSVLGVKLEQVIDADEALIRGQEMILSYFK